jgi:hypothetical protein
MPSERNRLSRVIWPETAQGSFAFACLFWPVVLFISDIAGIWLGSVLRVDDFGLAALGYLFPPCFAIASVAWIRAFILGCDCSWPLSVALAVLTLPALFFAFSITTFCFFPFGRVRPDF